MCNKCEQLDTAIDRYREFIAGGLLDLTALIQELLQRKAATPH